MTNQTNPTLYAKDKSGGLKVWSVTTDGSSIYVQHGKLGGKQQVKETVCEPKNVGRANETSPEAQAEIEALAKWVKQTKKGYFTTQEEALAYVSKKPMKAHDYKDYKDRVKYPCYIQAKLNGLRAMSEEGNGIQSKSGEAYKQPKHWADELDTVLSVYGCVDGEVFEKYIKQGGLSLQKINSAFKKPNDDTHRLKYWIYDIPSEKPFSERVKDLNDLAKFLEDNHFTSVCTLYTKLVNSEAEGDEFYAEVLEHGAEGVVYRNLDGLYECDYRSYNLIKRKPRPDAEARVLSVEKDKNNWGIMTCELKNGIQFKVQMRVDSHPTINYREYENAVTLIGGFITFEYEEFSDAGVPTKQVGIGLRDVNPLTWEPKE